MFQGSKLFRKISESKEQSAFIIRGNLQERGTAEFSILHSLHEKGSQSKEENVCLSSPDARFQPACWWRRGFPPPAIPQDSHCGSSSVQANGVPHLPWLLKSREQLLGGTSSQKKLVHTVISSNRWWAQRNTCNISGKKIQTKARKETGALSNTYHQALKYKNLSGSASKGRASDMGEGQEMRLVPLLAAITLASSFISSLPSM